MSKFTRFETSIDDKVTYNDTYMERGREGKGGREGGKNGSRITIQVLEFR